MSKLTRLAHPLLSLPILLSLSASSVPFAGHSSEVVVPSPFDQAWVPQDLSGYYVGRVYFGDKTSSQMIIKGEATLQILDGGKRFVLTQHNPKKIVKGKIYTAVTKDRPFLPAGEIEAENDSKIDIRWSLDKTRNRLKIVRASGVNRVFRFCTSNITQAQCKKDL